MRCHPVIRPGFHPLSIGLMILGFMLFWPLGLAMLAYMIWGDRMRRFADGVRDGFERHGPAWAGAFGTSGHGQGSSGPTGYDWARHGSAGQGSSGNGAFDAYRKAELERLEAERRRLDEERRAFDDYLASLRSARDKEEFDRFMAERRRRAHGGAAEDRTGGA